MVIIVGLSPASATYFFPTTTGHKCSHSHGVIKQPKTVLVGFGRVRAPPPTKYQSFTKTTKPMQKEIGQYGYLTRGIRAVTEAVSRPKPTEQRLIEYCVLHTTASPQSWGWQAIRSYFLNTLRWRTEGYHVVIDAFGGVKRLVPNNQPSNGILPFGRISNRNSVNISYIGGIDNKGLPVDNRTEKQKEALKNVVLWYLKHYPDIVFLGHNQIELKMCPCFDVRSWLTQIGVPSKNIYQHDNYNVIRWHKLVA